MLEAVPYQVHTILADSGIPSAGQPRKRNTIYSHPMRSDMICEANGIKHRLTKPNHPWSHKDQKTVRGTVFPMGGQVERGNRTINKAAVSRLHYGSHDPLRAQIADLLEAHNFARRLETLNGLTPYECIRKIWTPQPDRSIL